WTWNTPSKHTKDSISGIIRTALQGVKGRRQRCRRKVEMSYSRKVEMSYRPRFAHFPFPSSENVFRTARSCQGRAVVARRSEPLTASTVLDNGHGGKGEMPINIAT